MAANDKHVKAMRWLYEDEKSYRKAAAKLKMEELKARQEKDLIRQYRKRQRRIWLGKADSVLRPQLLKLKEWSSPRRLIYLSSFIVILGLIWVGSHRLAMMAALGPGLK